MNADFASIHNQNEQVVQAAVLSRCEAYPALAANTELLADVVCVALNHLPARYIRHRVDYIFYLTEHEAAANEAAITDAVSYAFEFVQARLATRARS